MRIGTANSFEACGSGSTRQGCGSGSFWSDPENYHRIRILSVLWQCKVVKTRKNIFKNGGFTHFQVNFSIFSDKNDHHSNIRRNMFDVKKI